MLLSYVMQALPAVCFYNECASKVLSSFFLNTSFALIFIDKDAPACYFINSSVAVEVVTESYKLSNDLPTTTFKAQRILIIGDNIPSSWRKHPKFNVQARALYVSTSVYFTQNYQKVINTVGTLLDMNALQIIKNNSILFKAVYLKNKCRVKWSADSMCNNRRKLEDVRLLRNLQSCTYVVAGCPAAPYAFDPDPNGVELRKGLDIEFLKTLIHSYGLKFEWIKVDCKNSPYKTFNGNGSYNGLAHILMKSWANLVVGGLALMKERLKFADFIDLHYGEEINYWAPAPKLYPPWKNFYTVFQTEIWLASTGAFLLVTGLLFLASFPNLSVLNSLFISWGFTFNGSFYRPRTSSTRMLLVMYALYLVMIISIYQSAYIQYRKFPHYYPQYEDAAEASNQGVMFYYPEYYDENVNNSGQGDWGRTVRNSQSFPIKKLNEVVKSVIFNQSGIIMMERTMMEYLFAANQNQLPGDRNLLTNIGRVTPTSNVIYVVKNAVLLTTLHTKAQQVVEAGLVEIWLKQIGHAGITELNGLEIDEPSPEPKPIRMNDFALLFLLCVGSLVVSSFAFLLELCWKKFRNTAL